MNCHNCGTSEPTTTTRSGKPLKQPGWNRHQTGAVACGPYCAGYLTVKRGLDCQGWTTPESAT